MKLTPFLPMRSRLVTTQIVSLSCLLLMGILFTGCSQSTSAPATERKSAKKVLHRGELDKKNSQVAASKIPPSGKKLDFVHADHFGLISLDVPLATASKTLSDVSWPQLEQLLQESVGIASLDSIERIWLALDREFFSLIPTGDENSNPVVLVVEQKVPFDLSLLEERLFSKEPRNTNEPPVKLEIGKVQSVTPTQSIYLQNPSLLISGSHAALSKIAAGAENQTLVDRFYQLGPSYLTGIIEVEPVRPQLKAIFDMIGSMGPVKEYAKLPDALKQLSVTVNLDSKEMAELNLAITDKDLAQLIANAIQSSNRGSSPMGMFGMGGMLGGTGIPGVEIPTLMYEPQMTNSMQSVFNEVAQKQLLDVRIKDEKVRVKLTRPETLDQLVSAIIEDQHRTQQLMERQTQATEIAIALQKYVEKFGQLPAAGQITPGDATENSRPQFNWLTGILPELGKQDLYDQFDFSKPFDDEANQALIDQMPSAFGKPTADQPNNGTTFFRAIGGMGAWKDGQATKLSTIKDREIWTAIVGESNEARVWTDPEAGLWSIDDVDTVDFGKPDENGWMFINAKFQVRIVVSELDSLSAIISPSGGEKLKRGQFIQTFELEQPE